jgi:hypothetical protein
MSKAKIDVAIGPGSRSPAEIMTAPDARVDALADQGGHLLGRRDHDREIPVVDTE